MARHIGRYEVIAELGRGGFGHVYRCLDPALGTQVAVKTLAAEGDAGMLTRFRNEAATSRKLTHANIVTIYDFGDQDGMPYIVMELLDGQDLHRVIESRAPLALRDKVEILSQIAAGLGHAHSHGIIHRDVKPANVMLLRSGSVKIMDFGIALITQATGSRLTPRGAMVGTFRYMAPEQFQGAEPDVRCDIFAFGLMSYELLSGLHPFHAPEAAALMYNTLSIDPVPLGEVVPECVGALQSVVSRLLLKDPDLRYQSLEDVMLDMEPVLLDLRAQKAEDLIGQARVAKSENQIEKARALTREALGLVPGHRGAREFREELQTELRRRTIRPRLEELLKKGREAMAAGNPAEAAQRFESAIHLDPNDTEIQELLREARAAVERMREAERLAVEGFEAFKAGNHTRAVQLAREALDLVPALIRAQHLVKRAEEALAAEQRERLLSEQMARARRLFEIRSWDAALELLAEAQREFPGLPEILALAEEIHAGQQKEEAERQLAEGLASARGLFQSGNLSGTLELLQNLTKRFPDSREATSILKAVKLEIEERDRREFVRGAIAEAGMLTARREFEAALRVLDNALSRYDGDAELQRERQSAMRALLESARRAAIEKAMALAKELRLRAQFADALKALETCLKVHGRDPAVEELRDSITQEQESARRTRELRDFIQHAKELIAKGQLETVTTLLRSSPGHLRQHPEITQLMNDAEREKRERAEKQAALDRLAEEAERLCEGNHFEAAIDALTRFETKYGDDSRAVQIRNRVLESQRQARQATLRAADIAKHSARARECLRDSRFADAVSIIDAALKSYPGHEDLTALRAEVVGAQAAHEWEIWRRKIVSHVRALLTARRHQDAWRALGNALASDPDNAELKELQAEVAESERRWRDEQEAARVAAEARQKEQARGLAIAQIRELLKAHRYEEATQTLGKALASDPDDTQLRELRAELAESESRWRAEQDAARAAAEAWQKEEARKLAVARARELLKTDRYDEAARILDEALANHPGNEKLLQIRTEISHLRERWLAEQIENRVRVSISAARDLIASRPAEAVSQLEELAHKHPGRTDIEPALQEARAAVVSEKRRKVLAEVEKMCGLERFDEALQVLQSLEAGTEVASACERVLGLQRQASERREAEKQTALRKIEDLRNRGKLAQARKRYRAAVERFGNDTQFEALLAQLTAPAKPLESAKRRAIRIPLVAAAIIGLAGFGIAAWYFVHRPPLVVLEHLEVHTDPAGAAVRVGSQSCVSPDCDLQLAPGAYNLSATRSGYQPLQRSLVIEPGKHPEPLALTLTPVPIHAPVGRPRGSVIVRTSVPEARVVIDGASAGLTDSAGIFSAEVEAAPHTVGVEKLGYDSPKPRRVIIENQKTREVALTLIPHPGRFELQHAPAGVEISLNGKLLGRTTGATFSMPVAVGAQNLRISQGAESRDLMRTFEPDRSLVLDWNSLGIVSKPQPAVVKVDPAEQAWVLARASTDTAPVQEFLKKYPQSPRVLEARSLLESLAWSHANQNDAQSLRDYLAHFPEGLHAGKASSRIADLTWGAVDKKDESALHAFIQQNPDNPHMSEAMADMDKLVSRKLDLEKQAATPKAIAPGPNQTAVAEKQLPASGPAEVLGLHHVPPSAETADSAAIKTLLAKFGDAYSRVDIRALTSLWPNLPKSTREGLQLAKSRGYTYRYSLDPISPPVVQAGTGSVAVRRTVTAAIRGQAQAHNTDDVVIHLEKKDGRWIITGM